MNTKYVVVRVVYMDEITKLNSQASQRRNSNLWPPANANAPGMLCCALIFSPPYVSVKRLGYGIYKKMFSLEVI